MQFLGVAERSRVPTSVKSSGAGDCKTIEQTSACRRRTLSPRAPLTSIPFPSPTLPLTSENLPSAGHQSIHG